MWIDTCISNNTHIQSKYWHCTVSLNRQYVSTPLAFIRGKPVPDKFEPTTSDYNTQHFASDSVLTLWQEQMLTVDISVGNVVVYSHDI